MASTNSTAPSIAIVSYFSPASSYPIPHDSQPPSPNGFSAAAILATLSDSRPPTSHGEDAEGLFDDDDDDDDDDAAGGISLATEEEILGPLHPPFATYHAPSIPVAIGPWLMDLNTQASLDQHAAALEALTMDQESTPPPLSTAPSTTPETMVAPPPNSGHQDWVLGADEQLSIQDSAAFIDIGSFVQHYAHLPKGGLKPSLDIEKTRGVVTRETLDGETCDFQGIDWSEYAPRSYIRANRAAFERSRLQHKLRNCDNFFAFRRMDLSRQAHCPHFQLRNVMTATSRSDIFYATKDALQRTDAYGSDPVPIVDLNKQKVNGNKSQITTLAAQNNVLVAGGFEGDYMIGDLASSRGAKIHFGMIKDWAPGAKSYIANHVHLFPSRSSYTPQAVLCSNDSRLRVLDCLTDTFKSTFAYPSAVNCSATSPDGRMRVVVGDFQETLITNAETGKPLETVCAHSDDAFACAWADDGIHVATAAQDSTVVVWDARFWRYPLTFIPSEVSIPRVLTFSPVGSGPRVLIAAEADDYVNIINAQTWDSKQVFDFFGPTAGISLTPDGQSLFVANTEQRFGGIIELDRTSAQPKWPDAGFIEDEHVDWISDDEMDMDRRVPSSWHERERRGINLGDLVV
ncbi:WD40 repeat-like protein [Massarina eburnea CBS 473.64]|uniref:WD40 repeat-like protein n=1 Tax=Massarina eburnea CBS 473.64 TaxID=1395130 RepID=A0A6A6RIW4_9PLEO|nr:WD40 repeat-like protein [Massarina eburnea CBS 473.64]